MAASVCHQFNAARRWSQYQPPCPTMFGRSYQIILHFGRAALISASPASVICVWLSQSVSSLVIPFRCSSPASVICVLRRSSDVRLVIPCRCFSPASVIFLPLRVTSITSPDLLSETVPPSFLISAKVSDCCDVGNVSWAVGVGGCFAVGVDIS
jgi:hypothetical protein